MSFWVAPSPRVNYDSYSARTATVKQDPHICDKASACKSTVSGCYGSLHSQCATIAKWERGRWQGPIPRATHGYSSSASSYPALESARPIASMTPGPSTCLANDTSGVASRRPTISSISSPASSSHVS